MAGIIIAIAGGSGLKVNQAGSEHFLYGAVGTALQMEIENQLQKQQWRSRVKASGSKIRNRRGIEMVVFVSSFLVLSVVVFTYQVNSYYQTHRQ